MTEVPGEGSLRSIFSDLEKRRAPAGSRWGAWVDVQKAGLASSLVDNKIAAFSPRLTSIRFVIPLALRKSRPPTGR